MRPATPAQIEAVLAAQDWNSLSPLLPPGCDRESALQRLREYCHHLITWNRTLSNLMSKNDERRIVARHLIESLEPGTFIASRGIDSWIDFGSGAGFPAIPLAVVGVGRKWTLVESRRPKTLFIRKVLPIIGLSEIVAVENGRLEMLRGALPPAGGFTARATERLGPTLEVAADFVVSGGMAFLWKGSSWSEEMKSHVGWTEHWEFSRHIPLSAGGLVVAVFIRK